MRGRRTAEGIIVEKIKNCVIVSNSSNTSHFPLKRRARNLRAVSTTEKIIILSSDRTIHPGVKRSKRSPCIDFEKSVNGDWIRLSFHTEEFISNQLYNGSVIWNCEFPKNIVIHSLANSIYHHFSVNERYSDDERQNRWQAHYAQNKVEWVTELFPDNFGLIGPR